MFHHRRSEFARNISDLEGRLHALENALERTGRTAGRRASAGISAAGDQIGDTVAPAVSEIVDRFSSGRRLAGDKAMRAAKQTVKFGGKIGNDALHRIASEVEHRPLVTLGIAIGVGVLIGIAGAGVSAASRPANGRGSA
jgi:ElaB/YqjD/DUF883 family membrane-anchored ribosome-binding protein